MDWQAAGVIVAAFGIGMGAGFSTIHNDIQDLKLNLVAMNQRISGVESSVETLNVGFRELNQSLDSHNHGSYPWMVHNPRSIPEERYSTSPSEPKQQGEGSTP